MRINTFFGRLVIIMMFILVPLLIIARESKLNMVNKLTNLQLQFTEYCGSNQYSEAIEIQKQILDIKKVLYGEDDPYYAESLNHLSLVYQTIGEYTTSIEIANKALNILKATPSRNELDFAETLKLSNMVMTLHNLATSYGILGEYSKSIDLCTQALEVTKSFQEGDYHPYDGMLLDLLCMDYQAVGDYIKAIELATQALEIKTNETYINKESYASTLTNLANCYSYIGDFKSAIKIGTELLDIKKNNQTQYAGALVSLASSYSNNGDKDKALELNTQALGILRENLGKEDLQNNLLMMALGTFYIHMGDYSKAIELGKKTLEIQKVLLGEESPDYAMSLVYLSQCHLIVGDYAAAMTYGQQAVEILEKTFGLEIPVYYAACLDNLALCYNSVGDYAKAIELGKSALEMNKKANGENNPSYVQYLARLSNYYLNLGDRIMANLMVRTAFESEQRILLKTMSGLTTRQRASYWNMNSVDLLDLYPKLVFFSQDSLSYGDLYDKSCLFAKGLLLATEMEMRNLVRESGDPVAQEKFDRLQGIRSVLNQQYTKPKEERLPNIKTMEDEAERLEQELMGMVSAYGDLMRNLKLTWRDVQSKLGERDVAVEFLSFPVAGDTTQYIALTVRKGYASPHLVDLFTSTELDDVRNEAYTDKGLSRLVWGRMATELEGVKNIYFSPSGELHNIGIESMPHWSDDCLMSDRFDLYRLSSTRELAMARNVVSSRGAMVYGGIEFGTSVPTMVSKSGKVGDEAHSMSDIYAMHVQKDRLARNLQESRDWKINDLPGTMTEAESVHKQLKSKLKKQDVVLLTGSDATEESFKRLSGNRDRVIHIATHGMYLKTNQASDNRRKQQLSFLFHDDAGQGLTEDESLSRSCLLFSGAQNTFNSADVKVPDSIDDGVLTAQEVSRLDLRGLDLLVLSACQTGLGDVTADGVMGLQRGFKKAGAQSIVMSLWTVDDAATRDMMEQFYKQLKPDLSNKREAFLNAQQDVRKNDGQYKYSNNPEIDARLRKARPHWAAFILLDALK